MRPLNRPDFAERGIDGSTDEQSLPADVIDLWAAYCALTQDQRHQFLKAGTLWQQALSHWGEQGTLSFALMVVACEALKPSGSQFKNHSIYQVVEALLGKATAERLREQWFRPQDVRNAHLHSGDFRGSEFVQRMMMTSYEDPSFDQAHRALAQIAPATIIEWLRSGGTFTMPPLRRNRRTLRRLVKDHFLSILLVLTAVGVAVGVILGFLIRTFWHG